MWTLPALVLQMALVRGLECAECTSGLQLIMESKGSPSLNMLMSISQDLCVRPMCQESTGSAEISQGLRAHANMKQVKL